jgi:hypothetical protein
MFECLGLQFPHFLILLKGYGNIFFYFFHFKELLKLYVNLLYRFCVTLLFLEIFWLKIICCPSCLKSRQTVFISNSYWSISLLAEVSICAGNSKEKRPLSRSDTFSVAHVQELPWQRVVFTTWYQTGFCGSNLVIQRLKAHTDRTRFGNATRIFSFQ